jgi:cytochrome c peroxidase
MSGPMRNALVFAVTVTLGLGAGCGVDGDDTEIGEDELESRITIPRVPNPPAATDLPFLAGDLRAIQVPLPPNLGDFVADRQAAIALGKALFWDMQVGSDGIQACASCHFRAGADPRSRNQVSPGLKHVPQADVNFSTRGPNGQLKASDFPLTRLATPGVRGALDPQHDSNDVVSSQGVHFEGNGLDPMGFIIDDINTRRVEPRNTPTVINAVFNHRQFWDGRAENVFNGVNHLGARDPNARVVRVGAGDVPALTRIELKNASLASQAVVPVLSEMEMSAPNRSMFDVAADLLDRRPLAKQQVHKKDGVLGLLSRFPAKGLTTPRYKDMVRTAFQSTWWSSNKLVKIAANGTVTFVSSNRHETGARVMSVMEYNFSLFFGVAIMMYESTLVSDNSPWDQFRREHPLADDPALNPWTNTNPDYISRGALFGAMLFNDRSRGPSNIRCSNCHESNEMTDASVRRIEAAANGPVRNRDGNVIDKGFNNIGVRPTADDLGVGASDEFGPLSFSRRQFPNRPPPVFDGGAVSKGFGIEGAFKIPSLRNVALTAPYFHNGDARTLREVIEFYDRGGNVAPITARDGTVIEPLGVPGITEDETRALIAFLKSLTDERVLYSRAPFDHPQLFVPNGHKGNEDSVKDRNHDELADDIMIELDAVGANGGRPIPGFLEGEFGRGDHDHGNGCDDDDDHGHGHGHDHGHH